MSTCEKCRSREGLELTGTHWICDTCFNEFYEFYEIRLLKVEFRRRQMAWRRCSTDEIPKTDEIPETEANALACLEEWLAAKPTENQPAHQARPPAAKKEKPSRSKEFWDRYAGY